MPFVGEKGLHIWWSHDESFQQHQALKMQVFSKHLQCFVLSLDECKSDCWTNSLRLFFCRNVINSEKLLRPLFSLTFLLFRTIKYGLWNRCRNAQELLRCPSQFPGAIAAKTPLHYILKCKQNVYCAHAVRTLMYAVVWHEIASNTSCFKIRPRYFLSKAYYKVWTSVLHTDLPLNNFNSQWAKHA